MLFHAVSGCDTVSGFLGRGKMSAWLAWSSCPSERYALLELSLQPVDVSYESLDNIERFIVIMYSRTCSASGVWNELFAQGYRTMENTHQPKRHCCSMCDARHTKQAVCGHGRLSRSLSCLVLHLWRGSHLIRVGTLLD